MRRLLNYGRRTTTQVELGLEAKSCLARSIAMIPALHPIPDRLKLCKEDFISNREAMMEHNDGVGEKREQLTIKKSTSLGLSFVFAMS